MFTEHHYEGSEVSNTYVATIAAAITATDRDDATDQVDRITREILPLADSLVVAPPVNLTRPDEPLPTEAQTLREAVQWVNAERTVLVRRNEDGTMTVATRDDPGDVWSPPIAVERER